MTGTLMLCPGTDWHTDIDAVAVGQVWAVYA